MPSAKGAYMTQETAGDGSPLEPVTGWQILWRTVMGTEHAGSQWDIDVDLLDWSENVRLYRDGRQERVQRGTSTFDLEGGARIDVAWSALGLRRARLVLPDGTPRSLTPAAGTAERWRADLDRERPALSRTIGIVSWTILAIALLIQVPQLLATVSNLTGWYEFASPVTVPGWLGAAFGIAGLLAALERALRLRHHWLLD